MNNEEVVAAIKTEKQCVLENIAGCDRNCGACGLALKDNEILSAYDKAISALERAEKYRWHDLQKNPDDLPFKNGNTAFTTVFVKMRQGFYAVAFYYNKWNGYTGFFYHGLPEKDIIAWREIEPFEEEE